ncbi:hypothetical protein CEXT_564961 [Caerostris extrusa]|uniref:Maturase n=1 Tax=Caerostris extrusa TaxID=172846 RepID=A0AAV4TIP7_CAEEX|nr:hypothetical protein CEXT_564961 [Caerostris extrusa]
MKSRYLWAQNRMAEQNIWRVRNIATRIRANSHRLSILGDVWHGSKKHGLLHPIADMKNNFVFNGLQGIREWDVIKGIYEAMLLRKPP